MTKRFSEEKKVWKNAMRRHKTVPQTISFRPTAEVRDLLVAASLGMGIDGIPNGIRSYLINLALRRALPWVMRKKGLKV